MPEVIFWVPGLVPHTTRVAQFEAAFAARAGARRFGISKKVSWDLTVRSDFFLGFNLI